MGHKYVNLLVHVQGLTSTEASILHWLAGHANQDGIAYPGVPLLMRESRYCERAIRYTLKRLEAKHLITKVNPPPEAHRRTAYAMTYAELYTVEPVAKPSNGHIPPSNGHRSAALVEQQFDIDDEWYTRRPDENIREYAARIKGARP